MAAAGSADHRQLDMLGFLWEHLVGFRVSLEMMEHRNHSEGVLLLEVR